MVHTAIGPCDIQHKQTGNQFLDFDAPRSTSNSVANSPVRPVQAQDWTDCLKPRQACIQAILGREAPEDHKSMPQARLTK